MEEQISKYFEDRPALLCYGKDFVKYVYDYTIERYNNAYEGKGSPEFVKQIKAYTESFTEDQINMLKLLTKDIIYHSVMQVIDRFEMNPIFKLVVEYDGKNINISELSDDGNELLFDMLGEDGLINLFSKYGADELL